MADITQLYRAYGRRVYRFLLALCGSAPQAEELTQEVFYRALLHIDRFEGRGGLFTWLCEIGKNLWLDEVRRRSRCTPRGAAPLPPEPPDPAAIAQTGELHRALRTQLANLPPEYRDVVILHVYGELPFKEIAARYGKSESWGRVTYYRAKKLLAQALEDYR